MPPFPDILVIECSTEACSVALFDKGTLVAGDYRMLGRGHAEALVPMIAALPGKGHARRIAIGLGPGSFTGVRIALAAGRALALAWGVEAVGYPTLALIAAMARAGARAQPVLTAIAAGHGEWFVQEFDAAGAASGALASLAPEAAIANPAHLVVGSHAEALIALRGHGEAVPLWPDARAALLLPPGAFTLDLTPIYGRAPDAKLPAA